MMSSSIAIAPPEESVMLTFRSSSASRDRAWGRSTGRSATDRSGAVTRRMMTSTSATSMIGVTLILVIITWYPGTRPRLMSTSHDRDLRSAAGLGVVQHAHKRTVGHAVRAPDHDDLRRTRVEERLQKSREARPRDLVMVHHHRLLREDRDLDPLGVRDDRGAACRLRGPLDGDARLKRE